MKRMLLTISACAMVLALSGCATTATGLSSVDNTLCAHKTEARLALSVASVAAQKIVDPVARQAAVDAVNVSLSALNACPVSTTSGT